MPRRHATIKYCYDGYRSIAEYDVNDNLLRKFIYGPGIDEPICMIDVTDSNAVYYYHFDGLGSVAALSNVRLDVAATIMPADVGLIGDLIGQVGDMCKKSEEAKESSISRFSDAYQAI